MHVGDVVAVTMVNGRVRHLRVCGIYDTNFSDGNVTAYISSATATSLVPQLRGRVAAIYVKTSVLGDEHTVIGRLERIDSSVQYRPWQSFESSVKDLTGSFDKIKSILNGVSLVVAAIAVFIVTYIDLVNRRRTIGIERAIGISGPAITIGYVLKAVVFAVLGVAFGGAFFYGVAMPFIRHHPFMFTIGPVTLSPPSGELRNDALILVGVAIVGALVPTLRTVRTRLLDAIWG